MKFRSARNSNYRASGQNSGDGPFLLHWREEGAMSDGREEREEREKRRELEERESREDRIDRYPLDQWEQERDDS
jgi:hypothetical protein